MNSLIVADFVLILLLLSIMLGKKNKLFADKFLILYLIFATVRQIYIYAEHAGLFAESYWMLLGKGIYLLHAPFFFLYTYALTKQEKFQMKYYLIFLPFVMYVLHFFYYYMWVFSPEGLSINKGLLYINGQLSISWLFFVILFLIIEPVFILLFYFLLRNYRKRMRESVSNTDSISLNWLKVIFYLWLLSAIILVPIGTLTVGRGWFSNHLLEISIEIVSIAFFFIVGFYGFKQTTVFTNLELTPLPLKTTSGNYERSGLSSQQAKILHSQLLALMEEKKPYLNGALMASELAGQLNVSANHLSQVLNKEQKQNFFDFVNSYRVREVILKMKEPSNSHLTLLALALESGFNSKTSFNTIFKKITTHTPSQYYKSINSKSL